MWGAMYLLKPMLGLVLILSLFFFITMPYAVENNAVKDVLKSPALRFEKAVQPVIIDTTKAGNRLVAVGERGILLVSDDNGKKWRQIIVPVSVTLTAVHFVNPDLGWVVGHSGIVLATRDAGENWSVQLNGFEAAEIEFKAAQAALSNNKNSEDARFRLKNAERCLAEGADKPFLALHFMDENQGIVVGAFGFAFKTNDGGETWESAMGEIDNPMAAHLYAVDYHQYQWIIAGEMGFLARSSDERKIFERIESPYDGTYFTARFNGSGSIYVGGLEGNAFVSTNDGMNFKRISIPGGSSFNDLVLLIDGRVLMANQAGRLFLESANNTGEFVMLDDSPKSSIISIEEAVDGTLITTGFSGIKSLKPSSGASED